MDPAEAGEEVMEDQPSRMASAMARGRRRRRIPGVTLHWQSRVTGTARVTGNDHDGPGRELET